MRGSAAILAVLAATFAANEADAARYKASKVQFQDITGEVIVTTTGGDDVEVTVRQGKVNRQVTTNLVNGELVIAGERWREEETKDCCNDRITRTENLRRTRANEPLRPEDSFFADYPVIEIAVPRNNDVSFTDARIKLKMGALDGRLMLDACYVDGETGALGQATIGVVSGSRLAIGDVKSMLELDVSGKAAVTGGSAAMADIDIAGPGVVMIGSVDGMLDVSIAGSGHVRTGSLDGPLDVRIAGSGGVAVQGGKADKLTATIDGSGSLIMEGAATSPTLRLYGSPVVRLGTVTGRITRHGAGEVYVGGKLVSKP